MVTKQFIIFYSRNKAKLFGIKFSRKTEAFMVGHDYFFRFSSFSGFGVCFFLIISLHSSNVKDFASLFLGYFIVFLVKTDIWPPQRPFSTCIKGSSGKTLIIFFFSLVFSFLYDIYCCISFYRKGIKRFAY